MTIYKGGIGQWAWSLHRASGVAVLLFLLAHIVDTALIMLGPIWYNKIIMLYRLPLFGVMEIGLFAAVLYHALNGMRVVLVDFFPSLVKHHEKLFLAVVAIFFIVFIPVAVIMVGHILHGGAA